MRLTASRTLMLCRLAASRMQNRSGRLQKLTDPDPEDWLVGSYGVRYILVLLQAPFCGVESCEDEIKELSKKEADQEAGAPSMGAKSLCIPFNQPAQLTDQAHCVRPGCQAKPQFYTLFGRSY